MARFTNHQRRQVAHHDEANIQRAVGAETYDHTADPTPAARYIPTAVDTSRLRGIPAIGKGVRGATPGSVPGDNLK